MPIGDKKGGFIRPGYDPLEVPNEPTVDAVTPGDEELLIEVSAPANTGGGAITGYQAALEDGSITATSSSSPVTLTGLTNETTYNIRVWALNAYGPGPYSTGSGTPEPATIGFFFPGVNSSGTSFTDIAQVNIPTLGNSTKWGDRAVTRSPTFVCANKTTLLECSASSGTYAGTIASGGTLSDFGDTTAIGGTPGPGCSNSTRAVFTGFYNSGMEYTTIATTGTFATFGTFVSATNAYGTGCGSSTRGIITRGASTNVIAYITIATTGNALDFGDLPWNFQEAGAASNDTRGIHFGGFYAGNSIAYITIATTGNAVDFGDITYGTLVRYSPQACADRTRCLLATSGPNTSTAYNNIEYITIASTGNAADFGDLATGINKGCGISNGHGGLQ